MKKIFKYEFYHCAFQIFQKKIAGSVLSNRPQFLINI